MNREMTGAMDIHINHDLSMRSDTGWERFFDKRDVETMSFSIVTRKGNGTRSTQ
jgi:hypothetical protein